jgi:hypothetical protein
MHASLLIRAEYVLQFRGRSQVLFDGVDAHL